MNLSAQPSANLFHHTDLINYILDRKKFLSYLEIGCQTDACFAKIKAQRKVGVDPVRGGNVRLTSDAFFRQRNHSFDLVFIDGLHEHAQVWRDLENSLRCLTKGGMIVMHDCLPPDGEHEKSHLCGTTWRAFVKARSFPDLDMIAGDFDYGIGLVRPGQNSNRIPDVDMSTLKYSDFVRNRKAWMNVRTLPEALVWIDKA